MTRVEFIYSVLALVVVALVSVQWMAIRAGIDGKVVVATMSSLTGIGGFVMRDLWRRFKGGKKDV